MVMLQRGVKLCFTLFIILFIFLVGILSVSYLLGPPPIATKQTTVLLDVENNVINEQANKIALAEISPFVIDATILVEDKHFYEHHGFDYLGIMRAMYKNVRAQRLKEGASTITQQLARNLYLTHEKTWVRKIKEALYTIRLEMFYSKDEILHAYLNEIYYGHGAYGIEAASNYFFDKRASELSLAEAAMLVGIPKGPSYYSPYVDIKHATDRQHHILKQLLYAGKITEAQFHIAKNEALVFADKNGHDNHTAPYFVDVVWQEAETILGESKNVLLGKGLTIHTTLNLDVQKKFDNLIKKTMPNHSDLQVALITIDPESGAIIQLTGGKNYKESPFNRVTQAKRMVGSTFKPFLYYAALENGFTANTMLTSEPTAFKVAETMYEPKNYNGYYAYEPISLAQALALSDNIYAVKTHLFLGPKKVAETARRFGITAPLPEVPALALGSASISLFEMVQAYSMLANGGSSMPAYTIEKITNKDGLVIYRHKKEKEKVLDEKKAFILTKMMTGMFDRRLNGYMEVTGSSISDKLNHEYAGKSGTTEADNWMIGFSKKLAVGVWTGYDNNQAIERMQERAVAKQLWASAIESAHQILKEEDVTFSKPSGVVEKIIDIETGLIATENCTHKKTFYFERGTEPTEQCHLHDSVVIQIDEEKEEADESILRRWLRFLR